MNREMNFGVSFIHFILSRMIGQRNWTSAAPVFNEDFDVVRGLEPSVTYLFRVVAVDGDKTATSEEQGIFTYPAGNYYKYSQNIIP